jgi:hypothetical protein
MKVKRTKRTATIKFVSIHCASIHRSAFDAIAGEPMFEELQGPPGASVPTVRDLIEPRRSREKWIRFGAGLVDRLTNMLRAGGIRVRVYPRLSGWSWPGRQPGCQPKRRVLKRVEGRPGSLAIIPKLTDRIQLAAEICELCPEEHILIAARNNRDAADVGKRLRAATKRTVTWSPHETKGFPWTFVASAASLRYACTRHWSLVIFMDAELVLSWTAVRALPYAFDAAWLGFLTRSERGLLPDERYILESLFGPVIFRPGEEAARSEVSVAWLPGTPVPGSPANIVERRRTQIWTNTPRNRLIARAARALRDNDEAELKRVGLHEVTRLLRSVNTTPSTAIVVENVEHAEELARLLPGWRLERACYSPPPGQVVQHDRLIVTKARAAEAFLATQAVFYAAGGADRWIEHVHLLRTAFAFRRMLIVDVADQFDEHSASETAVREAEYRALGFRLSDVPGRTRPGK